MFTMSVKRKGKSVTRNKNKEPDFVLVEEKDGKGLTKVPYESKKSKRNRKSSKKYKEFGKSPQFPMCMESYNRGVSTKTGSFECDEDPSLEEEGMNNKTIPISLECSDDDLSMIKEENVEVNKNKDNTQKLDKDYFLVRTYHRGGSCLVKVPLEPEEIEIIKKRNEMHLNQNITINSYDQEKNQFEELEEYVRSHPTNSDSDSMEDFTDFCQRRLEMENVKEFTEFCHSRLEIETVDQKEVDSSNSLSKVTLNNNKIETNSNENCPTSTILEDYFDLLHIMDDSGKIVWNHQTEDNSNSVLQVPINNSEIESTSNENCAASSLQDDSNLGHTMDDSGKIVWKHHEEEYNKDTIRHHDNTLLQYTSNQECNAYNVDDTLQNVIDESDTENDDIKIENDFENNPNYLNPKDILDGYNGNLETESNGFRLEVQSPDPRIYMDRYGSKQHLVLNSEPSDDLFA